MPAYRRSQAVEPSQVFYLFVAGCLHIPVHQRLGRLMIFPARKLTYIAPGVSVSPPIFPDNVTISVLVRPAASLYAAVKSSFAWLDIISLMCFVSTNIPGGNPSTEDPGLSHRSPVTVVVASLLLTAEPARTAKLDAPASRPVTSSCNRNAAMSLPAQKLFKETAGEKKEVCLAAASFEI